METSSGLNSNALTLYNHLKDSLLLTNKFLRVSSNLLIDLAMKPRSGFEPVNTGLVIGHYSFIVTNWCIKDLKYKLYKK